MQFRASEVVTGPIDLVFAGLSDMAHYERDALARGVQVERLDNLPRPAPGMQWRVPFRAKGRDRVAEFALVKLAAPTGMRFEGRVQGLFFESDFDCRVLDPDATEVTITTKLRAKSISAKVILQSMKLARASLAKQYRKRVRKSLRELEDRIHAPPEGGPDAS
ncbi:SRPBCC family protein [Dinoroseobacter sp. PD6]|uniref:SRPBCC family protein n=1 Tax=Dinoroseobacter sp. PD6 TaxID=3028384 RepID=UPI00237B031C|nr:SRPBCC family protein [Dinoroseobacter sp. PD6]MDD9718346.1 SRPBCC family protein [Dinoroseobacter sp. PD6]